MKEKYIIPELKLISAECEDIITTSVEDETPFVPFSVDGVGNITQQSF